MTTHIPHFKELVSEKEFSSVIQLPIEKRYSYAVKLICDEQIIWGLVDPLDSKWRMSFDNEGNEHIPFWPHSKYAEASAEGNWTGSVPKSITIDDFLTKWLPGMERDHLKVSFFPTPKEVQISVEPLKLLTDITEYCRENFDE